MFKCAIHYLKDNYVSERNCRIKFSSIVVCVINFNINLKIVQAEFIECIVYQKDNNFICNFFEHLSIDIYFSVSYLISVHFVSMWEEAFLYLLVTYRIQYVFT